MTRSLRWRLQLWHAVILTAAVSLFGVAFYRQLHHSTMSEIDGELLSSARVLEGTLRAIPVSNWDTLAEMRLELTHQPKVSRPGSGKRPGKQINQRPGESPPDRSEKKDDSPSDNSRLHTPPPRSFDPREAPFYFAIFSSDGRKLNDETRGFDVPWVSTTYPINYRNIDSRREILLRGPERSLIVVGRDVQRPMNRLSESLVQLIIIGSTVVGFGLIGGWWLSGKAIRPIAQISATTEKISASNLSDRIETVSMDKELLSLGTTLNSMLDRLEGSFNQQTQFTADASHELRTPISILLTHCELALNRPRSNDEYRDTINTCQAAALRMKSLVDNLLTLARADSDKLDLLLEKIDLYELAAVAVAMFEAFAAERQIKIKLTGDAAICQADSAKIAQVIVNLIQNAILYNRPNGEVFLNSSVACGHAILQVRDTGMGIPLESQPHVFDRFYRADESRTHSEIPSYGLGLAICKSIVDAHNGSLEVTSKPTAGSSFELRLPI